MYALWIFALAAAFLFAVWVAFPAVLGLLAASRRPVSPRLMHPATTVSVVVASRESAQVIRDRVANLLETTYPAHLLEVIVALDHTGAIATEAELEELHPRLKVLTGDSPGGKAATLNAGVRAASGEVLVFADSYQVFSPNAISLLVATLHTPGVGAASGRLELAPASDSISPMHMYWAYECWLRSCEARVHSCVGVFGPINAMRASLWRPLPAGLILDDVFGPMRLVIDGWRVAFVTHAVATDRRETRLDSEYKRKVRTLTGNIQLCMWLPEVMHPFRNPIWLQFLLHKVGRLLTPYALLVLAASSAILIGQWVVHQPPAIIASIFGLLALSLAARPWREGVAKVAQWILGIQAAVIMATGNGLRRRWDVWSR